MFFSIVSRFDVPFRHECGHIRLTLHVSVMFALSRVQEFKREEITPCVCADPEVTPKKKKTEILIWNAKKCRDWNEWIVSMWQGILRL